MPPSRALGEGALFGDQGVDFFLDGAAADELVDEDVALLADAEGAVGGLVLDGRVPPAVEVDDVRGGGQVQAGAAGLEREDEERRAVVALESVDELAGACATGVPPCRTRPGSAEDAGEEARPAAR